MALAVGVDVGGTKIAAGVVDERGRILARLRRESPASSAQAIEDDIADMVVELAKAHDVASVGVGAAGFVDRERAIVRFAANLSWRDEPLRSELESRLGIPTVIENDANAAAWAEFAFGAGRDVQELLLVTVGTGIGGGIVMSGQLQRGAGGTAAEIGHIRFVPEGLPCPCGNRGCWEQYASGSALVRDVRAAADADPFAAASLLERAGGEASGITGPMITAAAADGDRFAKDQVERLASRLGDGLASLTAVLDPAVIVVGGGVAEAGDLLIVPTERRFRSQVTGGENRPIPQIRKAALGNDAGIVGAADLSRA